MILCLDVGNSQIFGGVFQDNDLIFNFRANSQQGTSSDQIGVFLKSVLRENHIDSNKIQKVAIASVVPSIDYSLRSAVLKYLKIEPFFLKAGVKTGLKIKYHNPLEVGADRIADAIAASHQFPNRNIIIGDFGTASVFCAINKNKEYLGGAILPGMRLSMEALAHNTAKLHSVEIINPENVVGRSTTESIQSGLYFGHLGAIKEFTTRITSTHFQNETPIIIGTGGFSHLFADEKLFTIIVPDLVLLGLKIALNLNT